MRLLPLAFAVLAATPLHAQNLGVTFSPDLSHFEYGILCYYSNANPNVPLTPAQIAAIDAAGDIYDDVRGDSSLTVPAYDDVVFGIVSGAPSFPDFEVTSVLTQVRPDGTTVEDIYTYTMADTFEIDGWRLETAEPQDLGVYTFVGSSNGVVIYQATFEVVPAETYTGNRPACIPQR